MEGFNPEGLERVQLAGAEQIAHQVGQDPGAEARRRVGASRLDIVFGLLVVSMIVGLLVLWLLF